MELRLKGSLLDSGGVMYGQFGGLQIACHPPQVTHLLVQRRTKGPEQLVPLGLVASAQESRLWLRVSVGELLALSSPQPLTSQGVTVGQSGDGASVIPPEPSATVARPGLPGETTLRPGARVRARDGAVGEVLSIGLKGRTGTISHVLVRMPHLFRKAEVIKLDWSCVERIDGNTLYLNLTKSELRDRQTRHID